MSYVISPSGVSNPLTENLDADGNNISDAGTITVSVIDPADAASGVTIGSAAGKKVGFYGATPVNRAGVINPVSSAPAPPTYDNLALDANFSNIDDAINDILTALQNIGITA